jgi:peptidoglycan/xylan/chitin deacetylase (PgdA/CDA1 family)
MTGGSVTASATAPSLSSSVSGTAPSVSATPSAPLPGNVPNKPPAPPTTGILQPNGAPEKLRVLDWAGFKAAVTYTFDDSNSSQISHYAELDALGVPMTFYLQTGKSESADPVWGEALLAGHELGNHTQSHADTDDGSDTDAATLYIKQTWGVDTWTMAAPYGAAIYTDIAKTRFLLNRGVSDAEVAPADDTDPFTLPCYVPTEGAPASEFDDQVNEAHSNGTWQTFLVHGFTGGSDGAYLPVDLVEFAASVEHAKSLGDVWIDTAVAIGAYWRAQKTFAGVTPTVTGDTTTWAWTLPEHFPPGQYLRVTVDGGTLTQNGVALTWDEHGYYEVALDAGSLTLSPAL